MSPRDPFVPVAYGRGYTRECRLGCGERVWLIPSTAGGWMALTLAPQQAGNIEIDPFGRARVLGPDDEPEGDLYVAHQATCRVYLEQRAQERQTRLDIDG